MHPTLKRMHAVPLTVTACSEESLKEHGSESAASRSSLAPCTACHIAVQTTISRKTAIIELERFYRGFFYFFANVMLSVWVGVMRKPCRLWRAMVAWPSFSYSTKATSCPGTRRTSWKPGNCDHKHSARTIKLSKRPREWGKETRVRWCGAE